MSDKFNENTRVQVPATMHLCRFGYAYLDDIREDDYEPHTNILVKIFRAALKRLNPEIDEKDIDIRLAELVQAAKNDDLGREFFQKITATSGVRYIDNSSNKSVTARTIQTRRLAHICVVGGFLLATRFCQRRCQSLTSQSSRISLQVA